MEKDSQQRQVSNLERIAEIAVRGGRFVIVSLVAPVKQPAAPEQPPDDPLTSLEGEIINSEQRFAAKQALEAAAAEPDKPAPPPPANQELLSELGFSPARLRRIQQARKRAEASFSTHLFKP